VYGLKENVLGGDGEYRSSFQEEEGFDVEAYYEEEEEDEEDRSLDLLARFIHHMFKKISRKARKAARTILPSAISPQLVAFSALILHTQLGVFVRGFNSPWERKKPISTLWSLAMSTPASQQPLGI